MKHRYGSSTGANKKPVKIHLKQSDFDRWIVQLLEVKKTHGNTMAVKFVEESKKRFKMTAQEYGFALSLVGGKKNERQ